MTDLLLRDFGLLGRTSMINQVLDGRYSPPLTSDPNAQLLLPFLHRPPGVLPFDMTVAPADFINSWRRSKERTF